MVVVQRTSTDAYERLALAEPDRRWELHDGVLREKPPVTFGHSIVVDRLLRALVLQLEPSRFHLSGNFARVRLPGATYYVPDVAVIPVALTEAYRDRWEALEVYDAPLPLVVEAWSPSTGAYDVDTKLPDYRARGDEEVWRLHPFDRTLTVWRRRADGGYDEATYHGGTVQIASLPGVTVDLDELFAG